MAPSNIELFNELVVWILGEAYATFPGPCNLQYADAPIADPPMDLRHAFANTVDFLEREGFIINRTHTLGGASAHVLLTGRGLLILNSVPESVAGTGTLGERARSVAKAGIAAVAKDAAKQATQLAVNALMDAIMTRAATGR
jgi:hypothetical protein